MLSERPSQQANNTSTMMQAANPELSKQHHVCGKEGIIVEPRKCALCCLFHHVCTYCSCSEISFQGEGVKK